MITFVLGGARSGKSSVAEAIAARLDGVTYVATILANPTDTDLVARVATHRLRRSADWATIEPPYDLAEVFATTTSPILCDSLGPWLAAQPGFDVDIDRLVEALVQRTEPTILVSDEVGMGVHPETILGRQFRDELGYLNQAIANVAHESLFVVAGRVLPLQAP